LALNDLLAVSEALAPSGSYRHALDKAAAMVYSRAVHPLGI